MNRVTVACVVACALPFAGVCQAGAVLIDQFALNDHPDAFWAPPPYGLRLDGVFSSFSGATGAALTTFSFDTFGDVRLRVFDTDGVMSINISGTVFGGEDAGGSYGFGAGAYALNYNYSFGVTPDGSGYIVAPPSILNGGTLISLGDNNGVPINAVFSLFDSFMMPTAFEFLQDDFRLSGHSAFGTNAWVGRGWLDFESGGGNYPGYQDWLFVATQVIPLPTGAALGAVGLTGLVAIRRRPRM